MKVTGIGGGHGLAATLRAARRYADEVAAVVTTADDGGSSGRLSRELDIPPPGDIRNCLVALAGDEKLGRLYQHRFNTGPFTGHTVGNLVIAALTEMTGDFASAVAEASRLLKTVGTVHPATSELITLQAQVEGEVVRGQVAVAQSEARIQAVYLRPGDVRADPEAVKAILTADQVVLGPGSLFTSLIATLLVPGIRAALRETRAQRVFVCNTRMQKGETQGLDATAHIEALFAHAGPYSADIAVLQSPSLPNEGVRIDDEALTFTGLEICKADVASATGAHDPDRLAATLSSLGRRRLRRKP